jgi:hypothetical protein
VDSIVNIEQTAFVRGVAFLFYLAPSVLPHVEVCFQPLVKNLGPQNVELRELVLACRDVNENREVVDADVEKYLSVFFVWVMWRSRQA